MVLVCFPRNIEISMNGDDNKSEGDNKVILNAINISIIQGKLFP